MRIQASARPPFRNVNGIEEPAVCSPCRMHDDARSRDVRTPTSGALATGLGGTRAVAIGCGSWRALIPIQRSAPSARSSSQCDAPSTRASRDDQHPQRRKRHQRSWRGKHWSMSRAERAKPGGISTYRIAHRFDRHHSAQASSSTPGRLDHARAALLALDPICAAARPFRKARNLGERRRARALNRELVDIEEAHSESTLPMSRERRKSREQTASRRLRPEPHRGGNRYPPSSLIEASFFSTNASAVTRARQRQFASALHDSARRTLPDA